MAKDLDTYLSELQAALTAAGADRALVQDALFDAEEYLRDEMAERYEGEPASVEEYQTRFAAVLEGYGTPEEVAAAYLGSPRGGADAPAGTPAAGGADAPTAAPATAPPAASASLAAPAPPIQPASVAAGAAAAAAAGTRAAKPSAFRQVFGVVVDPAVYKALLYMLISLATGIAYFTIVVTGVSVSLGVSVIIIGIPLFLLVLGLVRVLALAESSLVEGLLGTRMPRRERAGLPEASWLQRVWFWVKDGRTWASMAYMILMLPLGIIYFIIAVAGLATGVGLVGSPFGGCLQDQDFVWRGVEYTCSLPAWAAPLSFLAGLGILLLWMHLIRWIGRTHAAFAKHMLVRLAR